MYVCVRVYVLVYSVTYFVCVNAHEFFCEHTYVRMCMWHLRILAGTRHSFSKAILYVWEYLTSAGTITWPPPQLPNPSPPKPKVEKTKEVVEVDPYKETLRTAMNISGGIAAVGSVVLTLFSPACVF